MGHLNDWIGEGFFFRQAVDGISIMGVLSAYYGNWMGSSYWISENEACLIPEQGIK